ncbi:MAG: N-6 DNA methylase [Polyangiaceae bacterium]
MTRRRPEGRAASRGQALRAAATEALRALAEGARSPVKQADLARVVLLLGAQRSAEAHHPEGAERLEIPRIRAIEEARARLREAPVPDPYELGAIQEALLATRFEAAGGGVLVTAGDARRLAGAHYTPRALAREVATRALGPLLPDDVTPEDVLALRVADAAMGAGAFLLAACEVLAERLARARGADPADREAEIAARRDVARSCLFGVDKDPFAVGLARAALWIATRGDGAPDAFLGDALRVGDALVGPPSEPPWPRGVEPFAWTGAFPEVLGARGGFDAFLGNPPWISYAGRAAQPLARELYDHYLRVSPAFFGYRNLQAIFVHRAATLLRPGGRLGLVVPTSMSDLAGYEPSRRAHDAWCEVDASLPDFGDRFDEVFQPCMGLLSTRRTDSIAIERASSWPLERSDLDGAAEALLARLDALPKVPAACFGERGFQSTGEDVRKMRPLGSPRRPGDVGLRIGSDVAPFRRSEPSFVCDPTDFSGRFRDEDEWRRVSVLVRQTARFPMACVADGVPFRNSVLACFADEAQGLTSELWVAYLNSTPVRWFHYVRHRDARQGMPQMKIAHLRALPCPADDSSKRDALAAIGAALSVRNDGARQEEQDAIDELAAELLGMDARERDVVRAWARNLAPKPAP